MIYLNHALVLILAPDHILPIKHNHILVNNLL